MKNKEIIEVVKIYDKILEIIKTIEEKEYLLNLNIDNFIILYKVLNNTKKDIIFLIETIVDAKNGENERLKEYGIDVLKIEDNILFSYKDFLENDKKIFIKDIKEIEKSLYFIFKEKYNI